MAESGKMPRTLFLSLYDSLPVEAKRALSELWDTGVNNSGVRVRFGDVEATIGRIVYAVRHEMGLQMEKCDSQNHPSGGK